MVIAMTIEREQLGIVQRISLSYVACGSHFEVDLILPTDWAIEVKILKIKRSHCHHLFIGKTKFYDFKANISQRYTNLDTIDHDYHLQSNETELEAKGSNCMVLWQSSQVPSIDSQCCADEAEAFVHFRLETG